jgi:hypothetical protein
LLPIAGFGDERDVSIGTHEPKSAVVEWLAELWFYKCGVEGEELE